MTSMCDYCKTKVDDDERFCMKHKVYVCEEHVQLFNDSKDMIMGKKCDFCILQKMMRKRLTNE